MHKESVFICKITFVIIGSALFNPVSSLQLYLPGIVYLAAKLPLQVDFNALVPRKPNLMYPNEDSGEPKLGS